MYEHKSERVVPFSVFLQRLGISLGIGLILIIIAVSVGALGYHFIEGLAWVDAFLNASLILSTMGLAIPPVTYGGKIFSAFYALFSGLIFVTIMGVVFAPIAHRFLHKFHAQDRARH